MAITAAMVKSLREKTGAGMMDCKKALTECDGNEANAVDLLRQKGLSKAAKKAGRATSEGLVGCVVEGNAAALAELKCETDFVARNEQFQEFAQELATKALAGAANIAEENVEALNDKIATLGENMSIGRSKRVSFDGEGIIGSYVHSNGKIASLVVITGTTDADMAKNVAMQIAATNPVAIDPSGIPADLIERERNVYREKTLAEGKPENIVDKIVEGRMQKFYKEITLVEQPYIRDDKMSIKDLLKGATITDFVRFGLGEDGEEA